MSMRDELLMERVCEKEHGKERNTGTAHDRVIMKACEKEGPWLRMIPLCLSVRDTLQRPESAMTLFQYEVATLMQPTLAEKEELCLSHRGQVLMHTQGGDLRERMLVQEAKNPGC